MTLEIEFPGVYGPIGDGVMFQALVDGATVSCIVTGHALDQLESHDWIGDPVAQFERNRKRLEDVAEALIMAGRVQERTLMINSSDVNAA